MGLNYVIFLWCDWTGSMVEKDGISVMILWYFGDVFVKYRLDNKMTDFGHKIMMKWWCSHGSGTMKELLAIYDIFCQHDDVDMFIIISVYFGSDMIILRRWKSNLKEVRICIRFGRIVDEIWDCIHYVAERMWMRVSYVMMWLDWVNDGKGRYFGDDMVMFRRCICQVSTEQ